MKMLRLALMIAVAWPNVESVVAAERTTVTPQEDTTSLLRNPAMGWVLYLDDVVAAFAAEFDNPAQVDFVDGNGLGWWGEMSVEGK